MIKIKVWQGIGTIKNIQLNWLLIMINNDINVVQIAAESERVCVSFLPQINAKIVVNIKDIGTVKTKIKKIRHKKRRSNDFLFFIKFCHLQYPQSHSMLMGKT